MSLKSPGVLSHFFFSTLSSGGSQLISFVTFVILARLLGTHTFGLVALAAFLIDMMQVIGAAGLGDTIVQRRTLDDQDRDTGFWINMGLGAILFCIMNAAAGAISDAYGQPAMRDIIHALSFLFIITPLGGMHTAFMRRELRFKSLAIRTLVASLMGAAVGIPMAYYGFGVWTLVAQRLVTAIGIVVACWLAYRWRPGFQFSFSRCRELIGFGGYLTGSSLLLQINARIAELMCGFFAGPAIVSFIRAGSRCTEMINQLTFTPIQQISMPIQARAQEDPSLRLKNYGVLSRLSSSIMFPAYFGCFAIADPLVTTVFGPEWQETSYVIRILALSVVPLQMNSLTISNVTAAGRARAVFLWSLAQIAVGVAAIYLAFPYGWKFMLAANLVRSYLLLPVGWYLVSTSIGVSLRSIIGSVMPALVSAIAMTLAVSGLAYALHGIVEDYIQLLILPVVGALVYAGSLAVVDRSTYGTVMKILRRRA
jgi:O-antigen/teichoic acid export membrane protein